jgi:hypothetical protein
MKKRLYLHIGQTKTGTTTLQSFLHANRAAIREQGICYPQVPEGEPLKVQHRFLTRSLHASGDDPTRASAVWVPYFQRLLDDDASTVVISEEMFWHLFEQHLDRRKRALAWVAETLRSFDLQIVCYLRRQDLWVESWFHQLAKAPIQHPQAALSLPDFIERQHQTGLLDYRAALGQWASAFGERALLVRSHDHDDLLNGNIVDDFSELIGLRLAPGMVRPTRQQQRMSPAACQLANLYGRTPGAAPFRATFLKALRHDDEPAGEAKRLLSVDDAQALIARYGAGNDELAYRYLGRSGLFAPVQDDPGVVFGGIDAHDVARLVMRLYVAQQRELAPLCSGADLPEPIPPSPPPRPARAPMRQTQPTMRRPVAPYAAQRPRLILHIGTHKTGTSSIQSALESARATLLERGVLYPVTRRPPFTELPKHCSVFEAAVSTDPEAAERERAILLSEFIASKAHTLVISEEGLSVADERIVRFFDPFVDGFEIHVVCFLRRQDLFVESLFNQYVRESARREARPLAKFVRAAGIRARMDYHALLAGWATLPAHIHAMDFDAAVRGPGVLAAFLALIGQRDLGLPPPQANPSPDMRLALLLGQMNQQGVSYDPLPLVAATKEIMLSGLPPLKHLLGADERQRLLSDLAESNQRLADVFGIQFAPELPDGEPAAMVQDIDLAFTLQLLGTLSQTGDPSSG